MDEGARTALTERGRSLLAAGVVGVEGGFDAEDAVEIAGPGRPGVRQGSGPAARRSGPAQWMGRRFQVVVHRDDLVRVR